MKDMIVEKTVHQVAQVEQSSSVLEQKSVATNQAICNLLHSASDYYFPTRTKIQFKN